MVNVRVRRRGASMLGCLLSVVLFMGVIGDTVGGVISDYILKRTGNLVLARRSVIIAGFLGAALVTVPARSREGSIRPHIGAAALAFVAATVLAVCTAIAIGTRLGPGLLVVGVSFGLCFAAASLLHLQARSAELS